MGAQGLAIRGGLSAAELRRLARREPDRSASRRMYAIANALEGMSRAEAARLAGLYNRCPPPRLGKLAAEELRELSAIILRGPDPEVDGLSAWTLPELCRVIEERFNKRFHPAGLSRLVRRVGFSRQKVRQRHPHSDPAAQEAFKKGGLERPARL